MAGTFMRGTKEILEIEMEHMQLGVYCAFVTDPSRTI